MIDRRPRCHLVVPRNLAVIRQWARVFSFTWLLLAIVLLPVQMRAGADEAHAHSLIQLLVDSRDGVIDHHSDVSAVVAVDHDHGHHTHAHGECAADPDVPEIGQTNGAGSGMPMLLTLVTVTIISGSQAGPPWHDDDHWRGLARRPESPPPQDR